LPPPAFDVLLDASPDALLAPDEDATILIANAAASRLFGYTRDELIGSNHWMLLSEGFRNETHLLHARLVAQPEEPQPPRLGRAQGPDQQNRHRAAGELPHRPPMRLAAGLPVLAPGNLPTGSSMR
jgi:PAS domain-containing protein